MKGEKRQRWQQEINYNWSEMQDEDALAASEGSGERAEWYIKLPEDCTTVDDLADYFRMIADTVGNQVHYKHDDPLYLIADWPRLDEQDFMEMRQEAREEVGR